VLYSKTNWTTAYNTGWVLIEVQWACPKEQDIEIE